MKEAHSTPRSIKLIEDFEELFPNDPGTLQLHTEIYSMSTHTHTMPDYHCCISRVCGDAVIAH